MAIYKKISRAPVEVVGYVPKFIIEEPKSETPIEVKSPIIEQLPVEDTSSSPNLKETSTPLYTGSKFDAFKIAYNNSGADPSRFNFFAKLAKKESGFDPKIQNKLGAPAYGYFQFMQGTSNGRS